ncbi:MAG TPA: hypothetical protein VN174_03815 [Candidatus Methanoperedens sp.]|nr:hypothetical protein [Candidatus Methanoperedens sp.]
MRERICCQLTPNNLCCNPAGDGLCGTSDTSAEIGCPIAREKILEIFREYTKTHPIRLNLYSTTPNSLALKKHPNHPSIARVSDGILYDNSKKAIKP